MKFDESVSARPVYSLDSLYGIPSWFIPSKTATPILGELLLGKSLINILFDLL